MIAAPPPPPRENIINTDEAMLGKQEILLILSSLPSLDNNVED